MTEEGDFGTIWSKQLTIHHPQLTVAFIFQLIVDG